MSGKKLTQKVCKAGKDLSSSHNPAQKSEAGRILADFKKAKKRK